MSIEINSSSFLSDKIAKLVWQNRKPMGLIVVIALICSIVISFIIPKKYKASTVLFAAYGNNTGHALLSNLPDEKDYMQFGEEKACEQLTQVLNSEAVMRVMMKKFDLVKYYKIAPDEPEKYALLRYYYTENFIFDITEYQSIRVDVYDRDPKMAALFANAVIKVADSIYGQILHERAQTAFEIVKQQYDSATRMIDKLQDSMNFYRQFGMLNYEFQVKELTRGEAEAIVKGSASNLQQIDDKMKPFEKYAKPYQNLYNQLFDLYKWMQQLKQSYIETKTNAEKTITPFFVVENAIVPDKKTYPIRWLIVVGGTFAGFFIGLFMLLTIKRFTKPKEPKEKTH